MILPQVKINVWIAAVLASTTLAIGYVSGIRATNGNSSAATKSPITGPTTFPRTGQIENNSGTAAVQPHYRISASDLFAPSEDPPSPTTGRIFTSRLNREPAPTPDDPFRHYTYTGSVTYGDQTYAMLMDDRSSTEAVYSAGDEVEGYTITSIDPEAVTLRLGKQDRRLTVVDQFNPVPMVAAAPKDVKPNPGTLTEYRDKTYQSFFFQVTGVSSGSIWGSGSVYTDDSALATAAVHAGVLKDGEAGVVRVTVLPGYDHYDGATSNGVTSQSYAQWQGSYRVDRL